MTVNSSLLSRLDRGALRSEIQSRPVSSEVEHSIINNLRRLFQIRQGNSLSAPRCGVPDFSDAFLSNSDPTKTLCEGIQAMVEEFEPRLYRVRVARLKENSPGPLKFEISAVVKLDNGDVPFVARTVLQGYDRLTVER